MKLSSFLLLLLFCCGAMHAQNLSEQELLEFRKAEQQLVESFMTVVHAPDQNTRRVRNSEFIPELVEVLKKPNSFQYKFENLDGCSVIESPDDAFRIFTWALQTNEIEVEQDSLPSDKLLDPVSYRYYGAIQLKSEELKLFPLIDQSMLMITPEERTFDNKEWFGCIYYNMIMKEHAGRKYYTLFGWDGNNTTSTIKLADILTFDDNGNPSFGLPIFEIERDSLTFKRNRFMLEFKKNSGVTLNYQEDKDLIVYDYIKPESAEARGNYNLYIPDGTYQGFKWEDGQWVKVTKVFHEISTKPMQLQSDEATEPKKKKKKRRGR